MTKDQEAIALRVAKEMGKHYGITPSVAIIDFASRFLAEIQKTQELDVERIHKDAYLATTEQLGSQLAASQARERVLRAALKYTNLNGFCSADACDKMEAALAQPQDSSALDALLASERERVCNVMKLQLSERQRGVIRGLK